jgi:hypothetical protein
MTIHEIAELSPHFILAVIGEGKCLIADMPIVGLHRSKYHPSEPTLFLKARSTDTHESAPKAETET